ncbi:MAG: MobF family relaxase [Leeuwenhoekiella sp.]
MIRMFQSQTAGHAKSYFRDALSRSDYYLGDQELNGTFNGRIAQKLNIEGQFVDRQTFEQLCDNINPQTGKSLTPRTVKDRRVGYDISFHCPKSVSILHALSQDEKVLNTFRDSVHITMQEMERDMQTRIRSQGQYNDRDTQSLLWTDFVHQTARPVDGYPPDPHLHCHCFTFNVTYDDVEDRFKAGQFHNIKRDMPYYQARFQKRLADSFAKQGYGIRKTKNGFELTVIPQAAIDHFSKRTNLIGQVAKEKGITNAKELDALGAKTRGKKQKNLSIEQLQEKWRDQLLEQGIDEKAKGEASTKNAQLDAKMTIDHSIEHSFARASVKRKRQLLSEGYLYAIDNANVNIEAIDSELAKNDKVFTIKSGNDLLCTTTLVLKEERVLVSLAVDGMGKYRPFNLKGEINDPKLGEEQNLALNHILKSQDRLTMIRGGAGTGKTTLIKNAVAEIEKTGTKVHLFAPTAEAARSVLKDEGFDKADTVARLLKDTALQEQMQDSVIWVDEAGMLGTSDASKLMEIAYNKDARVIFSGDPRQHSAVNRGDAMRILNTVGHVKQVSLETIYRQKQDQYRQAVMAISKGNITEGFKELESMKAIQETDYNDIAGRLKQDYLNIIDKKKTALIISPTREQARLINKEIREGLRERKKLNKREYTITVLENQYLTDAQKKDHRSYKTGDVIQAHQNMKGIKRGDKTNIVSIEGDQVTVTDSKGNQMALDLNRPDHFDVYHLREIQLSKGDDLSVTKNSFDENKKRLNNGTVLTVKRITKSGNITFEKKSKNRERTIILDRDFGNLDYAYCSTSYRAQGKTVDHVLINQPSTTFAASNQKQFYVSVSRGREGVTIYTDDKESLSQQIEQSGDREAGLELMDRKIHKNKGLSIVNIIKNLDIDLFFE